MGLGRTLARPPAQTRGHQWAGTQDGFGNGQTVEWTAKNTATGASETWFTFGGLFANWGGSDHYRGFMSIPAAWRASLLRADLLASITFRLSQWTGPEGEETLRPLPRSEQPYSLIDPDPPHTRFDWYSGICLDYQWHGNGVAYISERYDDNKPKRMIAVPAGWVMIRRASRDDTAFYFERTGQIPTYLYTFGGVEVPDTDILHVRGPCAPGEERGMGALETHFATLQGAQDLAQSARDFTKAYVPTGILKMLSPDAGDTDALALKAAWANAQRSRTIQVVNSSVEWIPVGWNPTEMQLEEARKLSFHELAMIFKVPLSLLGVEQSNRTYRNDDSEMNNLNRFSLLGDVTRFEDAFTAKYTGQSRRFRVEGDMEDLLRSSLKDRYEAYQIGIESGMLMRSEARRREGLKEIPGIDDKPLPGMMQGSNRPGSTPRSSQSNSGSEGEES